MLHVLSLFLGFCIGFSYEYSTSRKAELTAIRKLNWSFVETYAPLVYLDEEEEYNPSSVEFFLGNTKIGGQFPQYWTFPKEDFDETSTLSWYYGQDVTSGSVPVYAFVLPDINVTGKINTYDELIDFYEDADSAFVIQYNFFYPFNYGKKIFGEIPFGNHIGDIERCFLRVRYGEPQSLTCEYHGDPFTVAWSNVTKVNDTHPVVYAAKGSHAFYFSAGTHEYSGKAAALVGVSDETSQGAAWKSWENVKLSFPWEWRSVVGSSAISATEWAGVPYFLYIYRWGSDVMGIAAKDEWTMTEGPTGFIGTAYNDKPMSELFAEGELLCQGDDEQLCPIPIGLYSSWPCLPGYQLNTANVTTTDGSVCFLHPFGFGHDNCKQIVEPAFSCQPTTNKCGQNYGSAAWVDTTNGEEGGFCQLQNCRSYCQVELAERDSFPNNIPHWFQKSHGQWYPYETDTLYNESVRFDTGTSCNEYNHGLRQRFHNIPRSKCLSGFVYNSAEDACYINSYQYSECYLDYEFPPKLPPSSELQYKCYGSNDTCGDGWVGTCDDMCESSYCTPARQPNYETLMRLTHYVCDVNGEWVSFSDFESGLSEDSNNPYFTFDGKNVTKFTCELPTAQPEEISNSGSGSTGGSSGSSGTSGTSGTGGSGSGDIQISGGDGQSGTSGDKTGSGSSFSGGGNGTNGQKVIIWNGILILAIVLVLAFARYAYTTCYTKNKHVKQLRRPASDVVPLLA